MPNFTRLAAEIQIRLLSHLISRMGPENAAWLARRMMRDRSDPRARAFAGFAQQSIEAWKNRQYDVHRNGEAALFDVGANVAALRFPAMARYPAARANSAM